jgi:hypothetical protein
MKFGYCAMCLDIFSPRSLIREAVFPCGAPPYLIDAGLLLPGEPDPADDVPVPISSDDPLFQKWFGAFKRMAEE